MATGIKYYVSTYMGELALDRWGDRCCAAIKVAHEEYWLVLGVKQLKNSTQLQTSHCLSGKEASLYKAAPMWAGQG